MSFCDLTEAESSPSLKLAVWSQRLALARIILQRAIKSLDQLGSSLSEELKAWIMRDRAEASGKKLGLKKLAAILTWLGLDRSKPSQAYQAQAHLGSLHTSTLRVKICSLHCQ